MKDIVDVHYPDLEDALSEFYWLREQLKFEEAITSELIDWIGALRRDIIDLDTLKTSFPFLGVLLKRKVI